MSYRTYVNDTQVFGNNEWFQDWADFLESEGIEIDENGRYDGYITNLQGMFDVIDSITRKLIKDRHDEVLKGEKLWDGRPYKELTDLSDSMWLGNDTPLLMFNIRMIKEAYCFLPYQVYKSVETIIEPSDEVYINKDVEWFCCSYKLKEGKKIHVHAN